MRPTVLVVIAALVVATALGCSDTSSGGGGVLPPTDTSSDGTHYGYSEVTTADAVDTESPLDTIETSVDETAMTPSCIGSDLEPAYAAYDDECQDITETCQFMTPPAGSEGCFCYICGLFGPQKRCFYVCCHEDCKGS